MSPHRLSPVQRRLAAWADRKLVPVGVTVLLVLDLAVGLNWLLGPRAALAGPAYSAARRVLPMSAYGVLFVVAAAVTSVVFARLGRSWWAGYLLGGPLAGLWAYWMVLFGLSTVGEPHVSYLGVILAAALFALHLLFGLALTHLPQLRRTPLQD